MSDRQIRSSNGARRHKNYYLALMLVATVR